MKKIFCFGNEYVENDDLAFILADELNLSGFEFIKCYSPDFLMEHKGDLFILDVAKGIEKVEIIDDLAYLSNNKLVSLHDFDLGFFLRLLKEMNKLGNTKIIAVPFGYNKEKAKEEVIEILRKI